MSESRVIIITVILMLAFSYPAGYAAKLYFGAETLLGKVVHLSFVVIFFTSFYAVIKNKMMKVLKGKYDE